MGSLLVVIAQPRRQCRRAALGVWIRAFVGPAQEHCLNESLGLAIGLGSIGASAQMAHLVTIQSTKKPSRDVARAVVGHHPLDAPDSVCSEEAARSLEEVHRRGTSLIGEHLGV